MLGAGDDGGGNFVKRTIYAALAVLALSAPAAAQDYRQGYGPGGLPPHEILTILRSSGLDPLGQPMRRGPNYMLRAIDDRDREVSVVVSARSGEVLSVTPVQTASRMPPPRGGYTFGPYERMPPGYMPPGGYRGGAPTVDEDDEPVMSGNPNAPRPPGALPGPPPVRSGNAAPLPPRGGVMQPDGDDASPSEPNVITADPDRSGLLPPPPERFPQRAAPSAPAKPKPVQRAAAAPPKQAPLPRPKPAAKIDTPPAPPAQAAPEPAPPTAPAAEETPH
jgi:hypothetical protein